jgi:predicted O-methyltransferase YrrM
MTKEYKFTQNWFAQAEEVWPQLVPLLPDNPKALEIGSFEGRSMVWIAQNMLGESGSLTCIDTWEGSEEHKNGELDGAYERFKHNRVTVMAEKGWGETTNPWTKSISTIREKSFDALVGLADDNIRDFDFIYIDGSHTAPDVMVDACLAWNLLKPKGIMVFDDYLWGDARDVLHRPKLAVDSFTTLFAEQLEVIHTGYQMVIRKK